MTAITVVKWMGMSFPVNQKYKLRKGTDLFTFAVWELGTCFLLLKSPSRELERDDCFCTSND